MSSTLLLSPRTPSSREKSCFRDAPHQHLVWLLFVRVTPAGLGRRFASPRTGRYFTSVLTFTRMCGSSGVSLI